MISRRIIKFFKKLYTKELSTALGVSSFEPETDHCITKEELEQPVTDQGMQNAV